MSRTDLIKLAEAMGFMRYDRLGREVWYDPDGGHVSWAELPECLDARIDALIADETGELSIDDKIALAKRGNPFVDPSRS